MQLIRTLPCRLADNRRSALAIGNFDGLHRGHLALLEQVTQAAPELAPAIMCFEPLPRSFFRPDQPVPRLMKLRDRYEVCKANHIERLFQLRFNQAFANQSPEAFIDRIVLNGARAGQVVVGQDFRFGHKAAGDVEMLRQFGRAKGFGVEIIAPVMDKGEEKISSTRLRTALANGDLQQAETLLGRPYRISGRVLRGRQLGRELGFPTVNLRVAEPPALSGIFAVNVVLENTSANSRPWPGVASLGKRPTVAGRDWLLEVHLIDFQEDLYGHHLAVDFVAKRRDEAHFNNLDDMIAVMRHDLHWARSLLRPQTA